MTYGAQSKRGQLNKWFLFLKKKKKKLIADFTISFDGPGKFSSRVPAINIMAVKSGRW